MSGNPIEGDVTNLSQNSDCLDMAWGHIFGSNQIPETPGWLESQVHVGTVKFDIPPGTIDEPIKITVPNAGFCWYQVDLVRTPDVRIPPYYSGDDMIDYVFVEGEIPCGEEPPPPPSFVCSGVSASIVMQNGKMMVTGSGNGNGIKWEVVRVSDGEVMDSGNGSSASFRFEGDYKERYSLVFINESGERSNACSFEPTVTCPDCGSAYWETIPEGGVALKFYSVGECTVCKETNTIHLEVWVRLEGYVYFEVSYKGETLRADKVENTMAGDVWRLEFRFTWLEDRLDFSVWSDYENGIRIRDVAEFVKYTVCSDAPGLDDISTEGIATFQLGQQKSDWAVLLQQMGVVDDYQEGLDWAYQLADSGSLALPEMPST